MATTNGVMSVNTPAYLDASSNLGKRKRLPEDTNGEQHGRVLQNKSASFQNSMRSTLEYLRSCDPIPSILKHPLPANSSSGPELKRTRLSNVTNETETIEKKILDGEYVSYEDVLEDVQSLAPSILDENANGATVNSSTNQPTSQAKEKIATMQDFLKKASRRFTANVKDEAGDNKEQEVINTLGHDIRVGAQVLTVRTQTNTGPRQVFSGLQRIARLETEGDDSGVTTFDVAAPIDLRKLPNGFDLVEPSPLEAHMKQKENKQKRSLGEVFATHRNARPLEAPRPSNISVRGNTLDFISPAEATYTQRAEPIFKGDHVYSSLPTGQWLRYKQDEAKVDGLFQAAYSSFAPSYDDSLAVISQRTRADLWWQQRSKRHSRTVSKSEYPEDILIQSVTSNASEQEFADVVANFSGEEADVQEYDRLESEPNDVEDVLREVSDLLQTLSSYQRSRNLELSRTVSPTPSSSEFDTYELLRSQLSILVNTLPPFAVAKLDGDRLKDLNISTNFVTSANDFPGVGEPDDAELQRRRAKLAATQAASRTAAPVQTAARPTTYQAPSVNYAQRTPTYTSTTAPYARPVAYQTPRPPSSAVPRSAYPQAQYGTTPGYSQPTSLQQFQRPLPNGYPSYGTSSPHTTAHASQQKPMVNGHRPSTYGTTTTAASPTKAPTMTPQQQMLAERQAQVMRMSSGSATPGYSYDGANDKRSETPKTEIKAE